MEYAISGRFGISFQPEPCASQYVRSARRAKLWHESRSAYSRSQRSSPFAMKMSKSSPWILYSAALLSCFAASDRALAFGGLWSASDAPIKQSSERILLVDNPDSTVTAVVQLEYEGA